MAGAIEKFCLFNDHEKCLSDIGFTGNDLISIFSGVLKIEPDFVLSAENATIYWYPKYNQIMVTLTTKLLMRYAFSIHVRKKKIHISYITKKQGVRKGILKDIRDEICDKAAPLGYTKISASATHVKGFNGDLAFAKLGFEPTEPDVLELLEKTLHEVNEINRKEGKSTISTLAELVSTAKGKKKMKDICAEMKRRYSYWTGWEAEYAIPVKNKN